MPRMQSQDFQALDLNLLRVFDAVMAEGSLTRAAEKLALTQPAVSNALRRLRSALDEELFVRQGHGVQPTPRALLLWPVVRDALGNLQRNLVPETFNPQTATLSLVLAMADATAGILVPSLVSILEREAPHLSVRIVPLTTRDPRALLDAQTAGMAVGHFPAVLSDLTARAQSGHLVQHEHRRLYDGEYVAVMRKHHPLALMPLTLEHYCAARHALVSFSGRAYGFIDESLAALGRQRQIVLTVNQYTTAARVVAHSDLLTVLPRHFVPHTGLQHLLQVHPLPLEVQPLHIDALWKKNGPDGAAYAWLLQTLNRATLKAFTQVTH
jgi:DNA-binding transcriptional LysR family regulator